MNADWTQFPQYMLLALAVVTGTGLAAAAVVALVKSVLQNWHVELSLKATNLLAALLSGGMALPALVYEGIPWPMAALAVVAALFAPKTAYDNLTVAGKRKEALKATIEQGR